MENILHVRVNDEMLERLDQICAQTGLTRSQVLRHLLDNATIKPAIIRTEIPHLSQEGQRALA